MSKDTKKKYTREEKKKQAVRVLALIMAALMILGVAYYAIAMLLPNVSVSAASPSYEYAESIATSSLKNSGDVLISVGLMYGSNLTTGFEVTTAEGFLIGVQELYGDKSFTEIWELDETRISCTADDNLTSEDGTFLIADRARDADVGGYHLEVDCGRYDREEVEELIDDSERAVSRMDLDLFPCWIDGEYALRVGSFVSYDDAEDALSDVEDIFNRQNVSVVGPSRTAVSVVDPDSERIVFEFESDGDGELGLSALEDWNGNTYLRTPAGNDYDGVFCFVRSDNGEVDGVELINILPLESYVAGVLPYETSNTWPLEALKAFAITVRSFTLMFRGNHSEYGFDLCNTVCCQVYKGMGRVNERILQAVEETEGLVMTYDGSIVPGYYSSSVGGVTVSAKDAWGEQSGDFPYLQAVVTPWENYMEHENAFWVCEITPEALCARLNKAGCENLEDAIEDMEILELAENSTYVKKLRATDIYGNEATIEYTDNVRTSLTPYVSSANFVVGRGSVEYTEDVVIGSADSYTEEDVFVDPRSREAGYVDLDESYVITAFDIDRNYGAGASVATGEGVIRRDRSDVFVITSQNAASFLGEEYSVFASDETPVTEEKYNLTVIEDKSTDDVLYKVAYAEDEDNFIFVGKGWGHGVGMSQYGVLDMAGLGYTAEEMLDSYFSDIDITDYRYTDNFRW